MHNKLWYLQQIDLLKGMSESEMMNLAQKMNGKEYLCHELLYTPHKNVDMVYLLKKGEITIYYSHEGKKLILDVLKPGSIFGNINFVEGKSPHFAEASQDAFVCAFSQENFLQILATHPTLILKLFQHTAEKIGEYEEKMKGMLMNAKGKVLHQIKILQQKQSKFFGLFPASKIFISHEKLAEHCGISRETVTRSIQMLKDEGLIFIDERGGIIIL